MPFILAPSSLLVKAQNEAGIFQEHFREKC